MVSQPTVPLFFLKFKRNVEQWNSDVRWLVFEQLAPAEQVVEYSRSEIELFVLRAFKFC